MTDLSISITPSILTARYGLPLQVRFCRSCTISNQRPNSAVEFSHRPDSAKATISFDVDGVCDACRVAEEKSRTDWDERDRQLTALLDEYRSHNGAHDVLVPGSGGKDSYYAAHILKHRYGMNPLLVTWAPGLYTDVGWRNLQRWQEIADHLLVTPNRSVHALLVRLAVENLFHPFQPFTIGQKALAPKLAALFRIPLVMYGENEADYGNPIADSRSPIRSSQYHAPRGPFYIAGLPVDDLRARYSLSEADLSMYLPANPAAIDQACINVQYLGYYLKWKPQDCFYYAAEHGGFEVSEERTTGTYGKYSSLDDKLDCWHYLTTFYKFGIGRATYDSAQEIRSGDITREEGVALVRRYDGEWPRRWEEDVNRYLSVSGFPQMTRTRWVELIEKFKSPHLFDEKNRLRHAVWMNTQGSGARSTEQDHAGYGPPRNSSTDTGS
jgi:N-acetyl sugar amidotransferase